MDPTPASPAAAPPMARPAPQDAWAAWEADVDALPAPTVDQDFEDPFFG